MKRHIERRRDRTVLHGRRWTAERIQATAHDGLCLTALNAAGFLTMVGLLVTSLQPGCARIAQGYDFRLTAASPSGHVQWTLAGRRMTLVVQERAGAPAHTTASNTKQESTGNQGEPVQELTVTLDEQTALRVRRLFQLDPIQSLSRRYVNTCNPRAQKAEVLIETPKRTRKILLRGFLPPAIDILWQRILEHFPSAVQRRWKNLLRQLVEPGMQKPDGMSLPPGLSADACVSEEVGLVHDAVDELHIGLPARIFALAPKGWRLVLHVQTDLTRYYRDIPMTCQGCVCSGQIPQDILTEGTLYYYITAADRSGKQVDGAASKSSPNLVEVKSCLKFE